MNTIATSSFAGSTLIMNWNVHELGSLVRLTLDHEDWIEVDIKFAGIMHMICAKHNEQLNVLAVRTRESRPLDEPPTRSSE